MSTNVKSIPSFVTIDTAALDDVTGGASWAEWGE